MARVDLRRSENVDGDVFVDETCIDCDTCRWMAPETFSSQGGMSRVHRQPASPIERQRALMALVSCPTSSIGTVEKHNLTSAIAAFPERIDGHVYTCGYHHPDSYGAASYLIVRNAGNVLVDSPRFTRPLVRRIEALGGVKTMFLTHQDDVADHEKFHQHFGCDRVLHAGDAKGALSKIEHVVEGEEPISLAEDLTVIPVPGHTRGSACLLHHDYLFTGDHLAYRPHEDRLVAFRRACWYDWTVQTASMRRLAEQTFEWILPGHGRRIRFPASEMKERMQGLVTWMEGM